MFDLDVLADTEFEFCVHCYAPEGKYSESPCHLVIKAPDNFWTEAEDSQAMKLPHHGRKVIGGQE